MPQVADLMSCLGTSKKKLAQICSLSHPVSLSSWLNGKNTHMPAVLRAGAKAMQWYEANKFRQSPTQQALPPYKPADAKKARTDRPHHIRHNLFS